MSRTGSEDCWKHALIVLAVLITVTVLAAWSVVDWLDPFNDATFNAKTWSRLQPWHRTSMARDLVNNHLAAGMAETDVEALLGKPNLELKGPDAGGNAMRGHRTIAYYVGHDSFGGFDDAFVYIHLDQEGRVIEAEINGY